MITTYVSNIQKFCVYDGPGIRTVVFFMGCPLRCRWCQNPENFKGIPQVMFYAGKCAGCMRCAQQCKKHAVSLGKEGIVCLDRKLCEACGACVPYCLSQAREICGALKSVDEVFSEVMKDAVFYKNSGGGITLSGGECTMHPEFVCELLKRVKEEHVHTAIETCGYCEERVIREIAEYTDLFLYDFKMVTPELHEKWTGRDNVRIKENLRCLLDMGKEVVIRIPLIEGVNDGDEFVKMVGYLKQYPQIKDIHILPFHQLGSSKYSLSGQKYEMDEWKECSAEAAETCKEVAALAGFKVNVGGWNL